MEWISRPGVDITPDGLTRVRLDEGWAMLGFATLGPGPCTGAPPAPPKPAPRGAGAIRIDFDHDGDLDVTLVHSSFPVGDEGREAQVRMALLEQYIHRGVAEITDPTLAAP